MAVCLVQAEKFGEVWAPLSFYSNRQHFRRGLTKVRGKWQGCHQVVEDRRTGFRYWPRHWNTGVYMEIFMFPSVIEALLITGRCWPGRLSPGASFRVSWITSKHLTKILPDSSRIFLGHKLTRESSICIRKLHLSLISLWYWGMEWPCLSCIEQSYLAKCNGYI